MKKTLTYAILTLTSLTASAQTLTLDECRLRAMEHNKTLAAAKVKLEQTQHDMLTYRANYYPKVNLMAADVYSTANGEIGIDPFKMPISKLDLATGTFQYDMLTLPDGSTVPNSIIDFPGMKEEWKIKNVVAGGITIMQPVYMGGKITTAYNMSRTGVEMAADNIRLTESDVVVSTDEAYILAVKTKQLGDVARSYKTLLTELHKNVESAVKHGMATRNDLMKVQVKLNEAELNIQKADNGHHLACMNLCHVIGLPLDTPVDVDERCVEADTAHAAPLSACDINARPEVSILSKKTELAHQNIRLTKSEHMPSVMVGASLAYANGIELAGRRLIDGGSATAGIVVKVPIDVFGGASSKMRSAKAKAQIAEIEQQELNEKMILEVAQCRNNVTESLSQLTLCQTSLSQAEENMRLSKHQYEAGTEPLSSYLEAQAIWQQAGANLVQAHCQYLLSLTKLQKATGTLTVQ